MRRWCPACGRATDEPVCGRCSSLLRPGSTIESGDGLVIASGLLHRGPARMLVHRVKYSGDQRAADVLAAHMARASPLGATAWVPVPRARVRTWRYGVDSAALLADRLAILTGVPVVAALRAGLWWASHNKGALPGLSRPTFVARRDHVGPGWVLVDDVATTTATLHAAQTALGHTVTRALVATAPARAGSRLTDETDGSRL